MAISNASSLEDERGSWSSNSYSFVRRATRGDGGITHFSIMLQFFQRAG